MRRAACLLLALGAIVFAAPASSTTDLTMVTTQGSCAELVFAGQSLKCSSITSIHIDHSGRSSFTLEAGYRSIRFEGGKDMYLPPDGYLLFVDTIYDGTKPMPATGQCRARTGSSRERVLAVTCEVSFEGGKAKAVFKSKGAMSRGEL